MRQEEPVRMWKMHAFFKSFAGEEAGGCLKMVYTQVIEKDSKGTTTNSAC